MNEVIYNDGLESVVVEIKDNEEEPQEGSNCSMNCEANNNCLVSAISPLNIDVEVKR